MALVFPFCSQILLYHVYPDTSRKNFFKHVATEKAVFMFDAVNRLTKRFTIILFIVSGLSLIFIYGMHIPTNQNFPQNLLVDSIMAVLLFTFTVFVALSSTTISFLKNDDFYYNYSKNCFILIAKYPTLSSEEKSRMIQLGLFSYNKYLKKQLDRRLANLNLLHLALFSTSDYSLMLKINTINSKFTDPDKLSFLRYLCDLDGIEKSTIIAENDHDTLFKILALMIPASISISLFILSRIFQTPTGTP